MSALVPPPDGNVSRGPALLIVSIVFGVLATASTVMRLGARTFTHNLGWDDLAITIATILLDLQTVFTGLVYHAGGGRHQYYLSPSQTMEILRWNYASEVLLFAIIPATKISICLFVLRIKNTGWLKWLIYGLMAGLVITTVVPIIVLLVQCRPIEAFWNKSAGSCWSPKVINDVNYAQVGKFSGALSLHIADFHSLFDRFGLYLLLTTYHNTMECPDACSYEDSCMWSHEPWTHVGKVVYIQRAA